MLRFLRRGIGNTNRFLRLVSLFAAIFMWLTGRSRRTAPTEQPSRTPTAER